MEAESMLDIRMIRGTHKSARVFEYTTGMQNVCELTLRKPWPTRRPQCLSSARAAPLTNGRGSWYFEHGRERETRRRKTGTPEHVTHPPPQVYVLRRLGLQLLASLPVRSYTASKLNG